MFFVMIYFSLNFINKYTAKMATSSYLSEIDISEVLQHKHIYKVSQINSPSGSYLEKYTLLKLKW